MPERNEDRKLNPQIRIVEVGKKDLREVSIYPLSMKDQTDLSDIISEGLSAFFEMHGDKRDEISDVFSPDTTTFIYRLRKMQDSLIDLAG